MAITKRVELGENIRLLPLPSHDSITTPSPVDISSYRDALRRIGSANQYCLRIIERYAYPTFNYIGQDGNILSSEWFDEIRPMQCGFSAVRTARVWKYLSKSGRILCNSMNYSSASDPQDNICVVQMSRGFYFIHLNEIHLAKDANGNSIYRATHYPIGDGEKISAVAYDQGSWIVTRKDGKKNYANIDGHIQFPSTWYKQVAPFIDGYAKVETDTGHAIIKLP